MIKNCYEVFKKFTLFLRSELQLNNLHQLFCLLAFCVPVTRRDATTAAFVTCKKERKKEKKHHKILIRHCALICLMLVNHTHNVLHCQCYN